MSGGVQGKTHGVGQDIINYLRTIGQYFGITIAVTSGYRDINGQARAMFDNWLKLQRGNVYKKTTLPDNDRKVLDEYYNSCVVAKDDHHKRLIAHQNFLTLAAKTVGTKSQHCKGRAVDIARASLSRSAHSAILWKMREVPEGKRTDICHFECVYNIPPVSISDLKTFENKQHSHHPVHSLHHTAPLARPHHHILPAGNDDFSSVC